MQALAVESKNAIQTDARAGKYLAFHLGREEFGIRVMKVREIIGVQDITTVPRTAAYMKGVINLRGKVIPVVDLRMKFGFAETAYNSRTCIIVVQIAAGQGGSGDSQGTMLMGIVVDGVSEVLSLSAADIEDTPDFGDGNASPYVLGMAKAKGRVKILLDIDIVLSAGECKRLESSLV